MVATFGPSVHARCMLSMNPASLGHTQVRPSKAPRYNVGIKLQRRRHFQRSVRGVNRKLPFSASNCFISLEHAGIYISLKSHDQVGSSSSSHQMSGLCKAANEKLFTPSSHFAPLTGHSSQPSWQKMQGQVHKSSWGIPHKSAHVNWRSGTLVCAWAGKCTRPDPKPKTSTTTFNRETSIGFHSRSGRHSPSRSLGLG